VVSDTAESHPQSVAIVVVKVPDETAVSKLVVTAARSSSAVEYSSSSKSVTISTVIVTVSSSRRCVLFETLPLFFIWVSDEPITLPRCSIKRLVVVDVFVTRRFLILVEEMLISFAIDRINTSGLFCTKLSASDP